MPLHANTADAPRAAVSNNVVTLGRYEVLADPHEGVATAPATTTTVLGADQLQLESVDYPLEVLGKIPGLTLTDFNQGVITADVSMRGFNGEGSNPHVRLMVDGIPHNLNSGYNDLSAVFPLEMERVEAIKGPADPSLGLNAVAGAVCVHTHRFFEGVRAKVRFGSFDTYEGQLLAGYGKGGFNQTYFAGYRESDGYRDHARVEKHSVAGKWSFADAAARWRVGASVRLHRFEADAPGYLSYAQSRSAPRTSPVYSSTDGGDQRNEQYSFHAEVSPVDDLSLSLKAYRHWIQRNRFVRFTAAGSQQERVENEWHSGALASGRWVVPGAPVPLTMSFGGEYLEQNALNQRYTTNERIRSSTTRNHRYLLENSSGYLALQTRPVAPLRWDVGLRADRFSGRMRNLVSNLETPLVNYGTLFQPKTGLFWDASPGQQIYGTYGRSFQIGAGSGAYSVKPLDASKNDGYEIGLRSQWTSAITTRVTYWRQTATDEVKLKADGSGDSENVGETLREGVDLEASWRLQKSLAVWASYTLQRGEFVNPGSRPADAALKGKRIDHVPDYAVKLGADWDATRTLTASLSLQGQGSYYLTPANDTGRYGDQLQVDAEVRYRWNRWIVSAAAKNIFDRYFEYVWHDGTQTLHSPGDGRAFFGSVTWEF